MSTMTQKILFVAFSHTLTKAQIEDAKASLGISSIVTLAEVFAPLQAQFSQVSPYASTGDIIELAREIVSIALDCGATHFYVAGEPSLALHCSVIAHSCELVVVQSTTERKSVESVQPDGSVLKTAVFAHVQWRRVFGMSAQQVRDIQEILDTPIRPIL
jgi:hypothetical protein